MATSSQNVVASDGSTPTKDSLNQPAEESLNRLIGSVILPIRTRQMNKMKPIAFTPTQKRAQTVYGIELTKDGIGKVPVEHDAQYRAHFHQNPDVLNAHDGKLWQLPDTSRHVLLQRLPGIFTQYPIELRYYKDLELICKYWKCDPQDILPPGLRQTTPYSQAMLALLRRIASRSRNGKEQAHEALLLTVAARLQRENYGNLSMVVSTASPPKLKHASREGLRTQTLEEIVIMRRDGLMFEDAEAVRVALYARDRAEKKKKKTRRMVAKQILPKQRGRAIEMASEVKKESDESDSHGVDLRNVIEMAPKIEDESDESDSDGWTLVY